MAADLDLVYRDKTRSMHALTRALVARVFHAAKPYLGIKKGMTAELAVTVVGPTAMRALNRRWRKKDKPTDILAFPLSGPTITGYTAVSLGDLFICPAAVEAKAKAWGSPLRVQMKWTVVHGLLHLAGYDHEKSPAAARRMETAEQKILKSIG